MTVMKPENQAEMLHKDELSTASYDAERAHFHQKILSAVSHDLKTPLSSIIGSLEINAQMKAQLTPEKQQALLDLALEEAYRLDSFITNILDIAKLENHLVKVRFETYELGMLLRDCLHRLQLRMKDQNLLLHSEPEPLMIETDGLLLGRCLQILIDNAAVHGDGLHAIEVQYGQDIANKTFSIRILDRGMGIPEARLDSIFAKYTRYSKTDQQNAGTGLGLTICQEIMKLLGGTIQAGNNQNGGALFTMQLPLAAISHKA